VDSSRSSVQTVRVAPSRPSTERVALAVAVAIALAILKPWGDGSSGHAAPPIRDEAAFVAAAASAPSSRTAPPSRLPDPSLRADQIACPVADWRIVSLDRLADWTVRTWSPAEPAVASGPLDPSIPQLVLESHTVLGLGACASGEPAGDGVAGASTAIRIVAAWRRDQAAVVPVALERLERTTTPPADPRIALLYRPVASPAGATSGRGTSALDSWPAGRFVLELAPLVDGSATGPIATRWITVVLPGPL
jgi:hypothetical protein